MIIDDDVCMRKAVAEALRAVRAGEVPVGAVIARNEDGVILGRGHNLTITRSDPTAHAEIVAIRRAGRRIRNERLEGMTLYVTLEPCFMCLGAIAHARIERVVYGADDPKRGAVWSLRDPAVTSKLHHTIDIEAGLMPEKSRKILQDFFAARRLARHPRR